MRDSLAVKWNYLVSYSKPERYWHLCKNFHIYLPSIYLVFISINMWYIWKEPIIKHLLDWNSYPFISFWLTLSLSQATMLLSLIPSILEQPCKPNHDSSSHQLCDTQRIAKSMNLAIHPCFVILFHQLSIQRTSERYRQEDMTIGFLMAVSFTEYDQALPVCLLPTCE